MARQRLGDQDRIVSESNQDGDATGRHLNCRFWVRGHWARLPAGKGPSGHVPWREAGDGLEVWREAYIKGPARAPWRAPANPLRVVAPS